MSEKNIKLVLKDLLGRVPYNPIIHFEVTIDGHVIDVYNWPLIEVIYHQNKVTISKDGVSWDNHRLAKLGYHTDVVKPYLRTMESMTDEEREEYNALYYSVPVYRDGTNAYRDMKAIEVLHIDWFNAHHFDYRGLIEKGLALNLDDGMVEPPIDEEFIKEMRRVIQENIIEV